MAQQEFIRALEQKKPGDETTLRNFKDLLEVSIPPNSDNLKINVMYKLVNSLIETNDLKTPEDIEFLVSLIPDRDAKLKAETKAFAVSRVGAKQQVEVVQQLTSQSQGLDALKQHHVKESKASHQRQLSDKIPAGPVTVEGATQRRRGAIIINPKIKP